MNLTHECGTCGLPIETGGTMRAAFRQIREADVVHWTAVHDYCPREEGYEFPLAELGSVSGLLRRTAELHGKSWFSKSNWHLLLLRAADATKGQ